MLNESGMLSNLFRIPLLHLRPLPRRHESAGRRPTHPTVDVAPAAVLGVVRCHLLRDHRALQRVLRLPLWRVERVELLQRLH